MLLKSLSMHNFRQYKGTQRIDFSIDPEKNVTVILGDNTFGKTTLLQAFNWCFYDKVVLDNPDDLLNYDIAATMSNGAEEDVVVEIVLVHNHSEYTLTRSKKYTKVGDSLHCSSSKEQMCYTRDDGQTEPIKRGQIDKLIASILPEDLSSYFFFDTERVANVSKRKDLGESVKGLLGLAILDNAIKHMGSKAHKKSVLGKLYSSLDEDGDKRAKDALGHIQDAQDRMTDAEERLAKCDSEAGALREQKAQLDEILRDNAEAKKLQKDKEDKEARVDSDEASLERTLSALRSDYQSASLFFFARPLLDRADSLLKDAKLDDKGVRDLTRPTLEELLNRGVCVCGLRFEDHPEAVEHIKNEMRFVPPESIGNSVRTYLSDLSSRRKDLDSLYDGMNDRLCNIYATKERIQAANDDIEDLSKRISDRPNLSSYENARNDVKRQLKELGNRHDSLIRTHESSKSDRDRYQGIYNACSSASGKNRRVMEYIRYSEAVASWLTDTYSEKEGEIRDSLQERVNGLFSQMYHGHRRVVIDSKYQVHLLTDFSDSSIYTGESEGLNRVKNFAFIAGLVSLAKERIVSNTGTEEFDLSSEPYPLVMDAPFSNTDERHIANISRVLPEASEQVIMFVMMKDWRYAEPVLRAHLGASYELDKLSEQHSVLRSH